jgi:hypothetical protein
VTETVGSAADEAAKLLAAVQDWARTRFDSGHLATGASECQVCPLCQGIAALRHVKPETVEHLLDAAASVVAALRSTVVPPATPPDGSRVQHIDIREG